MGLVGGSATHPAEAWCLLGGLDTRQLPRASLLHRLLKLLHSKNFWKKKSLKIIINKKKNYYQSPLYPLLGNLNLKPSWPVDGLEGVQNAPKIVCDTLWHFHGKRVSNI